MARGFVAHCAVTRQPLNCTEVTPLSISMTLPKGAGLRESRLSISCIILRAADMDMPMSLFGLVLVEKFRGSVLSKKTQSAMNLSARVFLCLDILPD